MVCDSILLVIPFGLIHWLYNSDPLLISLSVGFGLFESLQPFCYLPVASGHWAGSGSAHLESATGLPVVQAWSYLGPVPGTDRMVKASSPNIFSSDWNVPEPSQA